MSDNKIIVGGVNFKSASLDLREKLAVTGEVISQVYEKLYHKKILQDAVILSTCNRIEIYGVASSGVQENLISFLADFRQVAKNDIEQAFYYLEDQEAVKHLFTVASSLDSMVVGEPQILGQVKDAYANSHNVKESSKTFTKLFDSAIKTAREVRTKTDIAEGAVSVGHAAVELAKKIFTDLQSKQVLIIGAGEMSEVIGTHLKSQKVHDITVCSRTFERGKALARKLSVEAQPFEQLTKLLSEVEIVISSTSSEEYVVTADALMQIMVERKNKPVLFVDISVPRNIDPAVSTIYNIFLFNIDELKIVMDQNVKKRSEAIHRAQGIIENGVEAYFSWLKTLDVEPTIVDLRSKFLSIGDKELDKLFQKIDVSDEVKKKIQITINSYSGKLVHDPIIAIKKMSQNGNHVNYVEIVRKLFALDREQTNTNRPHD